MYIFSVKYNSACLNNFIYTFLRQSFVLNKAEIEIWDEKFYSHNYPTNFSTTSDNLDWICSHSVC